MFFGMQMWMKNNVQAKKVKLQLPNNKNANAEYKL